jgi:hypothetical protein
MSYPRVWVVYTRTRTCIPDGYRILSNNVPTGRKLILYPLLYRIIPVGYSGFGYPLPSLPRTGGQRIVVVVIRHSSRTAARGTHYAITGRGSYEARRPGASNAVPRGAWERRGVASAGPWGVGGVRWAPCAIRRR